MKNAFIISMMMLSFAAKSQGPQQLVDVPYDAWPGATVKGWLYLPADYNTSNKKYPVVFFYHGLGEAGSNPYQVLNNGIPQLIAGGMRPDNITNPVDGQKYSFIVLSVQHWAWSPSPEWLPHELKWLKENYRIDTNRVYVTGLSAGGQGSFSATVQNNAVSRLITAAVPMSPASVWPYDPTLINQNGIETWFFSGNADGGYTVNASNYSTDCNIQYPGSSKLNIYSGGHCCWTTFYNTTWKDPSSGYSVWEWMLTNSKETDGWIPVPVDFISFDIKKEASTAKLTWKVAEEFNVTRYEIEKSVNGTGFSKIGSVNAADITEYHFTTALSSANGQYRIKAVDMDGKYKFSPVVHFNSGRASVVIKAFPIPAQNEITLQHPTAVQASRITITAADGRLVKTAYPNQGLQQTNLDLSRLNRGSYFVRYEDGTVITEVIKISKQ
jgi:dienelactone hydrolase